MSAPQKKNVSRTPRPDSRARKGGNAGLSVSIEKRIGLRDLLYVSDVASVCGVSAVTVYAWIECGKVEAINISVSQRPTYRIYRESLLKFIRARVS